MSGVPSWAPLALDPVPREAIARRSLLGAVAAAGVCPEALPAGGRPPAAPRELGRRVAFPPTAAGQWDIVVSSAAVLQSCPGHWRL